MIIYKARNIINNKIYIGKTKFKLEERRNTHIKDALRNAKFLFHKAIKKYGYENFHWEILERDIQDDKTLDSFEKTYILKFNSLMPFGYNMNEGGTGGTPAPEVRKRMSEVKIGRTKENDPGMKSMSEKLMGRTKYTHPYLMAYSEKRTGRTKETDPQYKLISERKKGRTKENDPLVLAMAEKLKGRTKETHEYLKKHSEFMKGRTKENSESVRLRAAKMKGRTKETHQSHKSQSEKMSGAKHPLYGKKRSEETKLKMSQSHKGRKQTQEHIRNRSLSRFKKKYPELFTFNKEIPPVLVNIQNPQTVDNIIQGRLNYGTDTSQRLEHQPECN